MYHNCLNLMYSLFLNWCLDGLWQLGVRSMLSWCYYLLVVVIDVYVAMCIWIYHNCFLKAAMHVALDTIIHGIDMFKTCSYNCECEHVFLTVDPVISELLVTEYFDFLCCFIHISSIKLWSLVAHHSLVNILYTLLHLVTWCELHCHIMLFEVNMHFHESIAVMWSHETTAASDTFVNWNTACR